MEALSHSARKLLHMGKRGRGCSRLTTMPQLGAPSYSRIHRIRTATRSNLHFEFVLDFLLDFLEPYQSLPAYLFRKGLVDKLTPS